MAQTDADDDFNGEEPGKPGKPRPGVTWVTLVLCFLNVLAALGFTFLLVLDYNKRQAWSYGVFLHDLALMGLPLEEEAHGPSAAQVTFPKLVLEPDQVKEAFTKRGGRPSEAFQAVNEAIAHPILPEHLTPEILQDWFKGIGEPVQTLEEEILRVKKEIPEKIGQAAQEKANAAKTEEAKRRLLETLLFSLAHTPYQIEVLAKKVKEIPAAQLDERLKDAAQRRLLVDILAPLEMTRPAERQDQLLELVADFDKVPMDRLVNLLNRRLDSVIAEKFDAGLYFGKEWADQRRDSLDKRHAIAYLLFCLSQAKQADGTPLYGPERLQAIIGLYYYAVAGRELTHALVDIYQRLLDTIKVERDGSVFQGKDGLAKNPGFVDRYGEEIQRLREQLAGIKSRQARLEDLQGQIAGRQKNLEERALQLKELTGKLLAARSETAQHMKELARWQESFFQAKVKLRDAHQQNLRLEQQLRRLEGLSVKDRGTP